MKSGFVAVAGRPNVGKSTLVNALCGEKVAIVSDKPQTTRRRIFGIATGDDYQLVLADLPGFQRPRDALTQRMQRTVDTSFEDVDAVLLVLDARERIGAGDRFVAGRVFSHELSGKASSVIDRIRDAPAKITLIALVLVILVVIATKAFTGRGTPLRGGLPSGHAAIAFAGWMAATYIVGDHNRFLVSTIVLIMALLVAQTRVEAGIHSTLEVLYGGLLGALTTLMIFQVFS